LQWHKTGQPLRKAFKLNSAYEHFSEYLDRIDHFSAAQGLGALKEEDKKCRGVRVWFCDRSAGSKLLSSEQAAEALQQVCDSGVQVLQIVIGGADGFSAQDYDVWKPALKWSFGPLTLPHELAAVVAAEQIYRAWTIQKNMPYHKGH